MGKHQVKEIPGYEEHSVTTIPYGVRYRWVNPTALRPRAQEAFQWVVGDQFIVRGLIGRNGAWVPGTKPDPVIDMGAPTERVETARWFLAQYVNPFDADAAVKEIRDRIGRVDDGADDQVEIAYGVLELFRNLDRHLTAGGRMPTEWRRAQR